MDFMNINLLEERISALEKQMDRLLKAIENIIAFDDETAKIIQLINDTNKIQGDVNSVLIEKIGLLEGKEK